MTASDVGELNWGQIVLLPFPFTDQSSTKKRPGFVVSSAAYNRARPDVIIMAITSQIRPDRTFQDVFLEDWQGAGLLRSSAIKPVITTIEQKLVIRKLGQLQSTDRQSLRALLHHLLDD